jgi:hypothetical protein
MIAERPAKFAGRAKMMENRLFPPKTGSKMELTVSFAPAEPPNTPKPTAEDRSTDIQSRPQCHFCPLHGAKPRPHLVIQAFGVPKRLRPMRFRQKTWRNIRFCAVGAGFVESKPINLSPVRSDIFGICRP